MSGLLIPMIMPVGTPLWMIALGTAFAVIFGKEVFGGTGMNVFNPALVARAFVFSPTRPLFRVRRSGSPTTLFRVLRPSNNSLRVVR